MCLKRSASLPRAFAHNSYMYLPIPRDSAFVIGLITLSLTYNCISRGKNKTREQREGMSTSEKMQTKSKLGSKGNSKGEMRGWSRDCF